MGAMNRLKEEKLLSLQALWRLAAAYALAGQTETAKQLTERASTDIKNLYRIRLFLWFCRGDWAMILENPRFIKRTDLSAPVA